MQQQPRVPLWVLAANLALITAAFLLGAILGSRQLADLPDPERTTLELVYGQILESHIEPPDKHELIERAISGMVDDLDEYSGYIPPRKLAAYDEDNTGNYQGIGALMPVHDGKTIVHFTFPGSPAEQAGLLPGDIILAVDEHDFTVAENQQRMVELVRGPADSVVVLRIDRDGAERTIEVQRGYVQKGCVKWVHFADPERGLGYLHLTDFHPTAHQQVLDAIESLQAQQELRGLIIDLRYDGGGSLDQCLALASTFLPKGVIATQYKRNGDDEIYNVDPEQCRYPDLPLIVLVNRTSASASELFSGALQDHDRAVIVGERTHGKGYVNTVYSWHDFDFKLKLTTGSYRTPNGRNIERNQTTNRTRADKQEGGIPPDVEAVVGKQLFETIKAQLHRSEVPAAQRATFDKAAAKHGIKAAPPPSAELDPQFAAAVTALRERIVK